MDQDDRSDRVAAGSVGERGDGFAVEARDAHRFAHRYGASAQRRGQRIVEAASFSGLQIQRVRRVRRGVGQQEHAQVALAGREVGGEPSAAQRRLGESHPLPRREVLHRQLGGAVRVDGDEAIAVTERLPRRVHVPLRLGQGRHAPGREIHRVQPGVLAGLVGGEEQLPVGGEIQRLVEDLALVPGEQDGLLLAALEEPEVAVLVGERLAQREAPMRAVGCAERQRAGRDPEPLRASGGEIVLVKVEHLLVAQVGQVQERLAVRRPLDELRAAALRVVRGDVARRRALRIGQKQMWQLVAADVRLVGEHVRRGREGELSEKALHPRDLARRAAVQRLHPQVQPPARVALEHGELLVVGEAQPAREERVVPPDLEILVERNGSARRLLRLRGRSRGGAGEGERAREGGGDAHGDPCRGQTLGGCFCSFRWSVRRCIFSRRAASEMLPLQSARMRFRYSHSWRSSEGTSWTGGGARFPSRAASTSSASAGLFR